MFLSAAASRRPYLMKMGRSKLGSASFSRTARVSSTMSWPVPSLSSSSPSPELSWESLQTNYHGKRTISHVLTLFKQIVPVIWSQCITVLDHFDRPNIFLDLASLPCVLSSTAFAAPSSASPKSTGTSSSSAWELQPGKILRLNRKTIV